MSSLSPVPPRAARLPLTLAGGGLLVACLALGATEALAQAAPADLRLVPHVGIGYVATPPEVLAGAAVTVLHRGWGVTADFQARFDTPESDRGFDEHTTPQEARNVHGDFFFSDQSAWRLLSLALVRAITSEVALYAGAGLSREEAYIQFADPTEERGFGGYYWVRDEEGSGTRTSLLGGLFFQAGRNLWLQLGVASQPPGLRVGASYMVPLGGR